MSMKSIGELHPNLKDEWHPAKNKDLTPYDVTPVSNKKM